MGPRRAVRPGFPAVVVSVVLAVVGVACEPASGDGGGGQDAAALDPPWRAELASLAEYEGLLAPGDSGAAGGVKYLAPLVAHRGEPPLVETCAFQDMARWRWHVAFLRTFPETATLTTAQYGELVLRNETRRWWGGTLRHWPTAGPADGPGGAGGAGLFTFEIYAEESFDNPLPLAGIEEVAGTLAGCVPFAADRLAFLPFGPSQTATAELYREVLAARGVAVVLPGEIRTIAWSTQGPRRAGPSALPGTASAVVYALGGVFWSAEAAAATMDPAASRPPSTPPAPDIGVARASRGSRRFRHWGCPTREIGGP